MGVASLYRAGYAIFILLQMIPKPLTAITCANNGTENINKAKVYTGNYESKEWKLHILHIACKDVTSVTRTDSQVTVEFAVELVNNHTDILTNYEVVVHTVIVETVGD